MNLWPITGTAGEDEPLFVVCPVFAAPDDEEEEEPLPLALPEEEEACPLVLPDVPPTEEDDCKLLSPPVEEELDPVFVDGVD